MSKLQDLINKCWELVEVHNVDGDLIPDLMECQDELDNLKPFSRRQEIGICHCKPDNTTGWTTQKICNSCGKIQD